MASHLDEAQIIQSAFNETNSALQVTEATNQPIGGRLDASVNNIPTSPDTTAGSRLTTGLSTAVYTHLYISNETATVIWVATSANTPSGSTVNKLPIPASSIVSFDHIKVADGLYIWSTGSAIITGKVGWGVW
jgi:hypothetical protein